MSTVLIVGSSSTAGPRPTRRERRSTRRGRLVTGRVPDRAPRLTTRPPRRPTVATVSTAGCGGRSTITTRRPRRRAATSFASAAVPPEFFVTTVSMRCRREQRHLVVDVERAAVEHDLGVGQDGVERFDGPHEEPQPRGAGEGLQALATEGEEDALGTQGRERLGGGRERRGVVPAVAHERRPWRAEQPAVGDAGAGRGLGGVERHDGGEGVRGVDELLDRLVGQVAGEAVRAAEAAPPHLAGPLDRVARHARPASW